MMYAERLQLFQNRIAGTVDIVFLPLSADLQYLTGITREFPNFGAVLHPGAWLEGVWFTPQHAPVFTLSRMSAELNGMGNAMQGDVRVLGDWDDPFSLARQILDEFRLSPQPRVALSDRCLGETVIALQQLLPDARFVSATELLRLQRSIKSEEEIAIMRQAGAITETAFGAVIAKLKIGMTELDIMAEVDYQIRQHGGAGPSFTTAMYNTGTNHPLIAGHPEQKWHRQLLPPVSLLFDFGAIYEGYCYDFGRTVAFGAPNAQFINSHRLVMEAQRAGIAALKANGHTCEQVDFAARQVIEQAGEGLNFRHRLGHSIGLDVHEPPFLTRGATTLLQEGMLFTIEPSILHDNGFSARVEDIVVARNGGGEPLTTGYQELIVVE